MDDVKHKDVILETIDQLRGRKARPDLSGICHMLERKHQLQPDVIERDLERLCELRIVIKQDYKGRISYRNAAKWRRSQEYGGAPFAASGAPVVASEQSGSNGIAVMALRAVRELTKDGRSDGCSLIQVEEWLKRNTPHTAPSHRELEAALNAECSSGGLRLAAGGYCRGKRQRSSRSSAAGRQSDEEGGGGGGSSSRRGSRSSSKRKRPRRSHGGGSDDDDDSYNDGASADATMTEEQRCDYCLCTAEANKEGETEELLVCKDCPAKAHPSCMSYSAQLARRAQMSPWQCIDCKTCCICQNADDPDSMLFCDACDKGYHMSCHDPAISDKPTGKWACRRCQEDGLEPGGQSGNTSPLQADSASAGECGNSSGRSSTADSDAETSAKSPSRRTADDDSSTLQPTPNENRSANRLQPALAGPSTAAAAGAAVSAAASVGPAARTAVAGDSPAASATASEHKITAASAAVKLEVKDGGRAESSLQQPKLGVVPHLPSIVPSGGVSVGSVPVQKLSDSIRSTASAAPPRSPSSGKRRISPVSAVNGFVAGGSNGMGANGGRSASPPQLQPRPSAPAAAEGVNLQQQQQNAIAAADGSGRRRQLSPPLAMSPKPLQAAAKPSPPPLQQLKIAPSSQQQSAQSCQPLILSAAAKQQQQQQLLLGAPPVLSPSPLSPSPPLLSPQRAQQATMPPLPSLRPQQQQPLARLPLSLDLRSPTPRPLLQQPLPQQQQQHQNRVARSSPSRPHALPIASTVVQQQQQQQREELSRISATEVGGSMRYVSVPPSEWTVTDVAQYFKNSGFCHESEKFMEQEIDGKSLLLLMRNDVLANMTLTLGSALKIYERVKMLQAFGSSRCLQQATNGQR